MKAAKEERLEEENRSINLSIVPHTLAHSHTRTQTHTNRFVRSPRSLVWLVGFCFCFCLVWFGLVCLTT